MALYARTVVRAKHYPLLRLDHGPAYTRTMVRAKHREKELVVSTLVLHVHYKPLPPLLRLDHSPAMLYAQTVVPTKHTGKLALQPTTALIC